MTFIIITYIIMIIVETIFIVGEYVTNVSKNTRLHNFFNAMKSCWGFFTKTVGLIIIIAYVIHLCA